MAVFQPWLNPLDEPRLSYAEIIASPSRPLGVRENATTKSFPSIELKSHFGSVSKYLPCASIDSSFNLTRQTVQRLVVLAHVSCVSQGYQCHYFWGLGFRERPVPARAATMVRSILAPSCDQLRSTIGLSVSVSQGSGFRVRINWSSPAVRGWGPPEQ
ncbi:uncharacterized protein LOC127253711 isoform X1 [Andrographis paniculata]|uniref:uncharacterized protein LOC127253711 isoform X1 n=1 Tax=Andrographis paniculata TaxID=175694 RepID=UPI0021E8EB4F|nr:uncharacterized protein LOC127253711 isoform X1 [Andrographis paniculata]